MIEVEATHITTDEPPYQRLACELYPGVLVVHGYPGVYLPHMVAGRVEPLPNPDGERTFLIREDTAEDAAKEYDTQAKKAEQRRRVYLEELELGFNSPIRPSLTVWPPKEWTDLNKK
ncbi:hypothetical protein [Rhodococcus sp. NPDC049939]|uniref:hypothetical protein n=1 Tax=Rhodococcus sp. NPDC049939 TaxID=3155511 RepID=UPI0033F5AF15